MKTKILLWGILSMGGALTGNCEELALEISSEESAIEVDVSATVDSFIGHLDRCMLSVGVDPETGSIHSADMIFNFADLRTGNEDRDAEMLKWEESKAFPQGHFQLTGLKEGVDSLMAEGTLQLHGKTHKLSFPVQIHRENNHYALSGETTVDYTDYNLPKIRKFLLLSVEPEVAIRFHLEGDLTDQPLAPATNTTLAAAAPAIVKASTDTSATSTALDSHARR